MDGDPIFAFDGAAALLRAWGGGLKPDPLLTVSEWADRYRKLSSRSAAEPGRYRTRRTPYMKEIMGALSPGRPAQRVVFMKAAQAQVRAPLAVDTPIPTPFGWSTMGDLAPGDLLYDEQGQVCGVTGVSEVMTGRDCCEIVFDDGERVTCDGEHRWPVWDFTNDVPVRKVLKTEEMTSRVRIGNSKRNCYAIDCCRPVEMPEQDLIINPYVLGMCVNRHGIGTPDRHPKGTPRLARSGARPGAAVGVAETGRVPLRSGAEGWVRRGS